MTEITFDQIKVGDRIKTREVFKDGSTIELEFTVAHRGVSYATNNYVVFQRNLSDRTELTITHVAAPGPKKIGTVVEYMEDGGLETAVLYTLRDDVTYPWGRSDGYTLTWVEILASDPNPKIKEN